MLRKILSLAVLLFASFSTQAQDVEETLGKLQNLKEQPLTITGGLRLGVNFYDANGIDPRRDNFQWNARAKAVYPM
ncbi:MAG: hypothetical protein AAGA31_21070, partial [Bacteroidota bacterium]